MAAATAEAIKRDLFGYTEAIHKRDYGSGEETAAAVAIVKANTYKCVSRVNSDRLATSPATVVSSSFLHASSGSGNRGSNNRGGVRQLCAQFG